MALTPAIFLDKDGTIVVDLPYNVDPEKMVLAPGAREGLNRLAKLKLPLIVITNQPGVALGKFGLAELHRVQDRLSEMFEETGASLSGFYFCPHGPNGHSDTDELPCACRKPQPGMLLRAAQEHHIDLEQSWFVGDILNDVEAGRRAGCRTILIDNGNETDWHMNPWRTPDRCVADFAEASRFLVSQLQLRKEALQ